MPSQNVDLSTTYLGLELAHPLMPGASPLVDDLDMVRQLEDAGAPAIVMSSLFEEQIENEQLATHLHLESIGETHAEATSFLPEPREGGFSLGPEEYLGQVRRLKETVGVPVIASLNGTSAGGWLEHAVLIEEAGADALELNVYQLATDPWESSQDLEERIARMVRAVKAKITIPVAVKLSPFYTALAHFATELEDCGADGLVIFNRFYQADLDVEALEATRTLELSTSSELLLRLRWLAILRGQIGVSLAATGGAHTAEDVVKALLCGADAVQVVSAIFQNGPGHLAILRHDLERWMEEHGHASLETLRGAMSLERCPDPHAYERANYMRVLSGWWRSLLAVS